MASGRQVTYTLNLNSNVSQILQQNERDAMRLDGTMWQLQKSLASFGIGLGATFIADAAKEWVKGAADFEQAMLRIKNASQEGFGLFNQDFLVKQVDRFKISLQDAADSYGKFLFFVKNTPYDNQQKNQLFQELNIVGKVGGISQENMDATMNNISKLLTEGVLEGRTLRNLSRVHPGIVPYLAEAMGLKSGEKDIFQNVMAETNDETYVQKLSQLISTGKLTKLHIDAKVLFDAFAEYSKGLEGKLPETLGTVNSELNQLGNTWLKFKNELVLGQKPELIEFFHSIESGIKWLSEHEESILRIGKGLVNIIELYAAWRIALMAIHIPAGIVGFFAGEQDRLNSVLGVSKEKAVYDNLKLEESELKLNEIEEIGIVKTNQVISAAVKESEVIKEKTVSLDLFTEAQIANIAASEKLRDEWVQMDIFGSGAGVGDAAFLGFGTRAPGSTHGLHDRYRYATEDQILASEAEQLALRGNLELEAAATAQASLFSKAELDLATSYGILNPQIQYQTEMMEANAIAAQQMAVAQEANAAAIALQADVLGASNYGNAMANIATMPYAAGNSIGKIPGLISSAVMPVFIAGMALEVANQFVPKGPFSKEEMGLKDDLAILGSVVTNGLYYPSNIGAGKLHQINEELKYQQIGREALMSLRMTGYDNPKNILNAMRDGGKFYEQKISPQGHELFNALDYINKRMPQLHLLSEWGLIDEHGNLKDIGNESIRGLAERVFGKEYVPYIENMITNPTTNSGTSNTTGTPKFNAADAKLSNIRGNSSNYVTINIRDMIGVQSYTAKYDKNGTKIEEEKLSEIVGTTLVKILTGVVNDSQLVGRHH